ncbi:MspA family porin [Nocardia sp. NBC_00416]|uniref:MspA family porin n=1 Tax=Nocardia sp. NBC_00416 TaxID=2975991 RepID=UPI002E1C5B35
MKSPAKRLLSYAMGASSFFLSLIVVAPSANAEIVYMAPHEKTFQSADGPTFVVGNTGETVNKVPPLNASGTVREVFLSGTAYSSVDAGSGGELQVGYHVGCAVELTGGSGGAGVTAESPGYTVGIEPGEVIDVPLVDKEIVPGVPGRVVYHDVHLVVNGCIGPAVIRQYTEIQMKSDAVDERGVVYGDPLWI